MASRVPPTMEELRRRVAQMYATGTAGSNATRKEADKWLQDFQCTHEAWALGHQLLADPSANEKELFIAALTLHTKISRNFGDLNQAAAGVLRDTLLSHIARFAAGPSLILNRLCLALGALATQWREWKGCIQQVVGAYTPKPEMHGAMVELLKAFAQEAESTRVRAHRTARRDFQDERDDCAPNVLKLAMQMLTSSTDTTLQQHVLEMVTVYIKWCRISARVLADSGIIQASFHALAVPALFDAGIEMIVQVLECYHQQSRHHAVISLMISQVQLLVPRYITAKTDENEEEERDLVRVFSSMGCSYVDVILGEAEQDQVKMVQLLLQCTDTPDVEICSLTFPFWFGLIEGYLKIKDKRLKAVRQKMLAPCFVQLIDIILRVIRYPTEFASWTADKQDEFRSKFRYDHADVLKDCCCIVLTAETTMNTIATHLGAHLTPFLDTGGAGNASGQGTWQAVEACLFGIRSIAQRVADSEAVVMPRVIALLPSLPAQKDVWCTTLQLLGRYSSWLNAHPEHLNAAIAQPTRWLATPELQFDAACAFSKICQANASKLGEPVLAVYSSASSLSPKSTIAILEGLCAVVSELPYPACVKSQQLLAAPMVTLLQQFVTSPAEAAAAAAAAGGTTSVEHAGVEAVVLALKKLTVIVQCVVPEKIPAGQLYPSVDMMQKIWPILEAVSKTFATKIQIIEKLTRLYKHVVKSCQKHAAPLVEPMMSQMMTRFMEFPHSGYLYVSGVVVSQFGANAVLQAPLLEVTARLANKAFEVLAGGLDAMIKNPDVVEDLFRLLSRCLEEFPAKILQHPLLVKAFSAAIIALNVEHKGANRNVLVFLETVIEQGVEDCDVDPAFSAAMRRLTDALLLPQAQAMVNGLIAAVVGKLPKTCIDDPDGSLAAVLYMLRKYSRTQLRAWLTTAFASVVPDAILAPARKPELIEDIVEARNDVALTHALLDLADLGYTRRAYV